MGALLAAACTDVPRRPLDPAAIERELAARSLADPLLRELCVARLGLAAEPWPPATVDLATLTLAAWHFRPELEAARAEVAVAAAKIQTAQTLPNPRLGVQPGWVADADGSPWFLAAALEFTVPLGDKRGRQAAVAAQSVEIERLRAAESAWRIYAEVRDALLEATFAQRELQQAQRAAELRAAFAAQLDALVRAGAAAGPQRLQATLDADRARADAAQAAAALALARARVAAACGLAAAEFDGRTLAPLQPLPGALPAPVLLDRLDLRRGLAEYELAERALELELQKQYPDLQLGPGYEYDQGTRKFLLGVGVELPLFDRNQGPIAEAVAQRDAVAARFREREAAALAAIDVARAEFAAAAARTAAFGDDALLRMQQRRDQAQRALAAGASARSVLTQVELELLGFEAARLQAERACLQAQAHLEDALQRPLEPRAAALGAAAAADRVTGGSG